MSRQEKQEKQEKKEKKTVYFGPRSSPPQTVNKKIIYEDTDTSWRTRGRTTRELELEAQNNCDSCILL